MYKFPNKICVKCKVLKNFIEFQYRKQNKDGRDNTCLECDKDRQKKRYKENKDEYLDRSAKRRTDLLSRSFLQDNTKVAYEACDFLNQVTGEWHEVDHIVPINNKGVCGLHVSWNLQILSKIENRSKGNKFKPD